MKSLQRQRISCNFRLAISQIQAEFETFDTSICIYADNAEETAELFRENNTQETRC